MDLESLLNSAYQIANEKTKSATSIEVLKVLKISGELNYGLIWDLNSSPWPWGLGLQPSDNKFMNIQNIRSSISDILLLCFCETTPSCSIQSMSQCGTGLKGYCPVGVPTSWPSTDASSSGSNNMQRNSTRNIHEINSFINIGCINVEFL